MLHFPSHKLIRTSSECHNDGLVVSPSHHRTSSQHKPRAARAAFVFIQQSPLPRAPSLDAPAGTFRVHGQVFSHRFFVSPWPATCRIPFGKWCSAAGSTPVRCSCALQLFIYRHRIYDIEAVVSPRSRPSTKTARRRRWWGQSSRAAVDGRAPLIQDGRRVVCRHIRGDEKIWFQPVSFKLKTVRWSSKCTPIDFGQYT